MIVSLHRFKITEEVLQTTREGNQAMEVPLKAIETTGTVDENHHLHVDAPLPIPGPAQVRVIVLYPGEEEAEESEWLRAAARNPAFDFLKDPEEDIYSLADGISFHDAK